jgi:hypothetical protein
MAGKKAPVEVGEEVEVVDVVLPATAIKQINTMTASEYAEWLASENVTVEAFDGGSEWTLIGDKADLVGVPFIIAMLRWNDVKNKSGQPTGKQFVSVMAYTKDEGKKIVFNDGSTGVAQQLSTYVAKHDRDTGILCDKGLRVSEYDYEDPETGITTRAKTYYIA